MPGRPRATAPAILVAVLALVLGACAGSGDDDGGGGGEGSADSARINELYERLSPGVLFVQARVQGTLRPPLDRPPRSRVATGSAFAFDREGHVVTNAHVVENAESVALRDGDRLVDARVVGTDLSTDLAVLEVDTAELELTPLTIGDSRAVEVGDEVLAIGNPFGLEDTVTSGIVSARHRRIAAPNGFAIEDVIQTDAAINPGNSGGPLVDMDGRVIGVNSQIATAGASRSSAGVGFAVPAATVREIVPDLIDDGRVERPFLGVTTIEVTPSVARNLDLGVDSGALVVGVAPGSPADRAGIRSGRGAPSGALLPGGDVIVRIAGTEVSSPQDVAGAVLDARTGESVDITIVRNGERRTLTARLVARPGSD
jgi:S1-C subfamily serine protease